MTSITCVARPTIVSYTMEPAQRDAAVDAELHQVLDSIRIQQLP